MLKENMFSLEDQQNIVETNLLLAGLSIAINKQHKKPIQEISWVARALDLSTIKTNKEPQPKTLDLEESVGEKSGSEESGNEDSVGEKSGSEEDEGEKSRIAEYLKEKEKLNYQEELAVNSELTIDEIIKKLKPASEEAILVKTQLIKLLTEHGAKKSSAEEIDATNSPSFYIKKAEAVTMATKYSNKLILIALEQLMQQGNLQLTVEGKHAYEAAKELNQRAETNEKKIANVVLDKNLSPDKIEALLSVVTGSIKLYPDYARKAVAKTKEASNTNSTVIYRKNSSMALYSLAISLTAMPLLLDFISTANQVLLFAVSTLITISAARSYINKNRDLIYNFPNLIYYAIQFARRIFPKVNSHLILSERARQTDSQLKNYELTTSDEKAITESLFATTIVAFPLLLFVVFYAIKSSILMYIPVLSLGISFVTLYKGNASSRFTTLRTLTTQAGKVNPVFYDIAAPIHLNKPYQTTESLPYMLNSLTSHIVSVIQAIFQTLSGGKYVRRMAAKAWQETNMHTTYSDKLKAMVITDLADKYAISNLALIATISYGLSFVSFASFAMHFPVNLLFGFVAAQLIISRAFHHLIDNNLKATTELGRTAEYFNGKGPNTLNLTAVITTFAKYLQVRDYSLAEDSINTEHQSHRDATTMIGSGRSGRGGRGGRGGSAGDEYTPTLQHRKAGSRADSANRLGAVEEEVGPFSPAGSVPGSSKKD